MECVKGVTLMETPDWVRSSPCLGKASFLWFPPMEAKDPNQWYEMGRVVCSTCEVWQECLSYGKEEKWGMWGGLTPKERKSTSKRSPNHGHWTEFRRGCDCLDCQTAHFLQMNEVPVDIDVLPDAGDPEYDDPSRLLFQITS